jgi:transcriptional regulator with XRE-family HTH domain
VQEPSTGLQDLVKPRGTYQQIADEADCSLSMIQKVARGERKPNAAIKAAVEKLFRVPASLVFGDED